MESCIHKSLLPTAMYIFNKFDIISLPPYNSLLPFFVRDIHSWSFKTIKIRNIWKSLEISKAVVFFVFSRSHMEMVIWWWKGYRVCWGLPKMFSIFQTIFISFFSKHFPFSKPQLSRRGFPTHLWRRPSETRSPGKNVNFDLFQTVV